MVRNTALKTRDVNDPYEIWKGEMHIGGEVLHVEYRVLKKWQVDDDKPYARWFCAAKSEATFGSYDIGDTYVVEIKAMAQKVEFDPNTIEKW